MTTTTKQWVKVTYQNNLRDDFAYVVPFWIEKHELLDFCSWCIQEEVGYKILEYGNS